MSLECRVTNVVKMSWQKGDTRSGLDQNPTESVYVASEGNEIQFPRGRTRPT